MVGKQETKVMPFPFLGISGWGESEARAASCKFPASPSASTFLILNQTLKSLLNSLSLLMGYFGSFVKDPNTKSCSV